MEIDDPKLCQLEKLKETKEINLICKGREGEVNGERKSKYFKDLNSKRNFIYNGHEVL